MAKSPSSKWTVVGRTVGSLLQIINRIADQLLKIITHPLIDPSVKIHILLVLSIIICLAFYALIIIVYAIFATLPSFSYVLVIPGMFLLLILCSLPLFLRAGNVDAAIRLGDSFHKIYEQNQN